MFMHGRYYSSTVPHGGVCVCDVGIAQVPNGCGRYDKEIQVWTMLCHK